MERRQLLGTVVGCLAVGFSGCNVFQSPYEVRRSGVLETEEPVFRCCADWEISSNTTDYPVDGRIIATDSSHEVVHWDKMVEEKSLFAEEFMGIDYSDNFLSVSAILLPGELTIVGSSSTFNGRQMTQTLKIAPRKAPRDGPAYNTQFELWRVQDTNPPTDLSLLKEFHETPIHAPGE